MHRVVRRVPADWKHPTDESGEYIPLRNGADYEQRARQWEEEVAKWQAGMHRSYDAKEWEPIDPELRGLTYSEVNGDRPDPTEYTPQWTSSSCTHWQMYEDTTEGTPISPVCGSQEELAQWLVDNETHFGEMPATYDEWLSLIQRG